MSPQNIEILDESPLWYVEQYAYASRLEGATRVPLAAATYVPNVHVLRKEERNWRPLDYPLLPKHRCRGPGYTLLEDTSVIAPGMVLTVDGRFVRDPATRLIPHRVSPLLERALLEGPAFRAAKWPKSPDVIEQAILLSRPGVSVYGHWLLDFLPPLSLLDQLDEFADWPLLLSAGTPSWVDAMIRAFGGRPRTIIRFPKRLRLRTRVRQLCVPWGLREQAFHPIAAEVFDRVTRAHLAARPGSSDLPARKIYIDRPAQTALGAKSQLTNAEQVRAIFVERGFEPIRPELLSFPDQIRLFAGARAVAGEAGSGLHGTVFSEPGISTIELRPASYHVLGQPAIAVLKEQGFLSIEGAQRSKLPMNHDPWTLDLDEIQQRLSADGPF